MSGILSSAGIISASILLSRVLGLVRDILAASLFGTSWIYDAFVIAFIIPNMFRRIFGEGALTAAFVPIFTEHMQTKSREDALRYLSNIISSLSLLLSIIAFIGMFLAIRLGSVASALGLGSAKLTLIGDLSALMLPYMPLVCLVAILAAALNCVKHFAVPAFGSVLLNVSWIVGLLFAYYYSKEPIQQVTWMAWAIVGGGAIELIAQLPMLKIKKLDFKVGMDFHDPAFRQTLALLVPVVFGLSIVQINYLADNLIAEICVPGDGAVSALYYGNRIMQLPLALFGIALAQAAFPYLAEYIAKKDFAKARESLVATLNNCLLISVPASVGLAVLAVPVTRLLFERGNFTDESSLRTSAVILAYATGIWSMGILQIITRAFYSFKDMRTPVKYGMITVLMNLALNLTLVWYLQEAGLALATSICSALNVWFLTRTLAKKTEGMDLTPVRAFFLKTLAGSLVMGAAAWATMEYIPAMTRGLIEGKLSMLLAQTIVPIGVGAGVYFVIMRYILQVRSRK